MKKNENNSVGCRALSWNGLFNRIKNSLKKFSKKSLGKVGLFLVLGIMVLNIDFNLEKRTYFTINKSTVSADGVLREKMEKGVNETAQMMGFDINSNGEIEDLNIGKPVSVGKDGLGLIFKWLLQGVLLAVSELAKYAGLFLDFVLRQDFVDAFIKSEGVYKGWVVVRDVLNMFFMLILLFSAFSTIFQVDQYHLRKFIVMLIVMALLVNFSFPITRFVIDFSNSAMYFLLDNSFGQNVSYSGHINKFTDLGKAIGSATSIKDEISSVIMNIILTFIVFVTFFAIALNFLIRILAFVILMILAPAGFTFAFFSGTKSIANEWWGYLFKYAFLGPVMAFFLFLSLSIFDRTSVITRNNSYFSKDFVIFTVPIVFLWIGLTISQRFGGEGSAMAMGFAKKTRDKIKGYGQKAAWGAVASTGIPGAVKERYKSIKGNFDSSREKREANIAKVLGSKDAESKLERKNYEEDVKKMKNFTVGDLEAKAKTGNVAAANELLSRKALSEEVYRETIKNSKNTKRNDDLTAKFKGANKESRIDVVASIDANKKARDDKEVAKFIADNPTLNLTHDQAREMMLEQEINKIVGDMKHSEFSKQNFGKIAAEIERKSRFGDNLEKVEANKLRDAIENAFNGLDPNAKIEVSKNISKNQRVALNKMRIRV